MVTSRRQSFPRDFLTSVGKLAALPEKQVLELAKAFESTPPTLQLPDYARAVSSKVSISQEDVSEIVNALFVFYTVKYAQDDSLDDFLRDLSGVIERDERHAEVKWDELEPRLRTLLIFDETLGVAVKAGQLWFSHERTLSDVQIISDIRPIFTSNVEKGPTAAMITHVLRIAYRDSERYERRDFYIALDAADIKKLRDALDRAEQKAKGLKSSVKESVRMLEEPS